MSVQKYKIVFSGRIIDGFDINEVKENLARTFKATVQQIEPFFNGKSFIKENLDYEAAIKYQENFRKLGAVCEVVRMEPTPTELQQSVKPDAGENASSVATGLPFSASTPVLSNPAVPNDDIVPAREYELIERDDSAIGTREPPATFNRHLLNVVVRTVWFIPVGGIIVISGAVIGGLLEILLPKGYLIGGRIAVKSFNIGTLSWFEGAELHISINAQGKGIALKEERE